MDAETGGIKRKRNYTADDLTGDGPPSTKLRPDEEKPEVGTSCEVPCPENAHNLLNFCDEVLSEICRHLDTWSMLALMNTHKRFKGLLCDRYFWNYIELSQKALPLGILEDVLEWSSPKTKFVKFHGPTPHELGDGEIKQFCTVMASSFKTRCIHLQELELQHIVIDFNYLNILDFPKTLKRIMLKNCSVREHKSTSIFYGMETHLVNLEELGIEHCDWFEPYFIMVISKVPALRWLSLQGCRQLAEFVPYGSLASRFGFKSLEYLDLRGTPITDSDLQCFNVVHTLKEILLDCPENMRSDSAPQGEAHSEASTGESERVDSSSNAEAPAPADQDGPSTSRGSAADPAPLPIAGVAQSGSVVAIVVEGAPYLNPRDGPAAGGVAAVAGAPGAAPIPCFGRIPREHRNEHIRNAMERIRGNFPARRLFRQFAERRTIELCNAVAAEEAAAAANRARANRARANNARAAANPEPALGRLPNEHNNEDDHNAEPVRARNAGPGLGRPPVERQVVITLAPFMPGGRGNARAPAGPANDNDRLLHHVERVQLDLQQLAPAPNDAPILAGMISWDPRNPAAAVRVMRPQQNQNPAENAIPNGNVDVDVNANVNVEANVNGNANANGNANDNVNGNANANVNANGNANNMNHLNRVVRHPLFWDLIDPLGNYAAQAGIGAAGPGPAGRGQEYGNSFVHMYRNLRDEVRRLPNPRRFSFYRSPHPISDRGICCFGRTRSPVDQGVVWIRVGNRPNETNFERMTVRNYIHVTDITLRHLVQCAPRLRFLDLSGTSVTRAAIEKFKRRIPTCHIVAEHLRYDDGYESDSGDTARPNGVVGGGAEDDAEPDDDQPQEHGDNGNRRDEADGDDRDDGGANGGVPIAAN